MGLKIYSRTTTRRQDVTILDVQVLFNLAKKFTLVYP